MTKDIKMATDKNISCPHTECDNNNVFDGYCMYGVTTHMILYALSDESEDNMCSFLRSSIRYLYKHDRRLLDILLPRV
jgi:hypothetical protein